MPSKRNTEQEKYWLLKPFLLGQRGKTESAKMTFLILLTTRRGKPGCLTDTSSPHWHRQVPTSVTQTPACPPGCPLPAHSRREPQQQAGWEQWSLQELYRADCSRRNRKALLADLAPAAGRAHESNGKKKGGPIFSQETDRPSQERLTALKG